MRPQRENVIQPNTKFGFSPAPLNFPSSTQPSSSSKGDEFEFQLLTPENRIIVVKFHREETIGILKRRIAALLIEHGHRPIPLDRQRLLFNNQILQPDSSPVYWIAGVGSQCQIHLVENNPNENNYRSIAQLEYDDSYANPATQGGPVDERDSQNRVLTFERFRNFRVLQRNFQACVEAAQRGQDPAERLRHNEANGVTPDVPDSRDLGYMVREMANAIQNYSFLMARLSDDLVRDQPFESRDSVEYQRNRRLIQNLMDAARYLGPELENFCNYVIPLGSPPRRVLSVVADTNTE